MCKNEETARITERASTNNAVLVFQTKNNSASSKHIAERENMLFYLFSFLLYICILLLILPIGKTENDGNRGRQKNVDFLRVRLRLYSALRFPTDITISVFFLGQKFVFFSTTIFSFPRCCHCGCLLRTFDLCSFRLSLQYQ